MPYIRKLPSGKWQATVRTASGRRVTRTDRLKKIVVDWATDEEAKIARGLWHDPRSGRITVPEFCARWFESRVVEPSTLRGDESAIRLHLLPYWQEWPMGQITRLDVQGWVRKLQQAGVGAHMIRRVFILFCTMMNAAVVAEVVGKSPIINITLPPTPAKLPSWFTRDQVNRIRAELDVRHRGHSVMTELMCVVGLRWGEAAAVCGAPRPDGDGNPVDWKRGRIPVVGQLDQNGRWKEYPKTEESRNEVPVPRYILDEMAVLLQGRTTDARVFVSPRAKANLSGANWRGIWYDAIRRANARIAEENAALPEGQQIDPIPEYDPHDCRHTAASWLAQAGVPLSDIQKLLRHEKAATTERYAHLLPNAHDRVEAAWKQILPAHANSRPGAGVQLDAVAGVWDAQFNPEAGVWEAKSEPETHQRRTEVGGEGQCPA